MARIPVAPGLSVHVEVDDYLWPWDDSPAVVMLHGFARNGGFWRRWVPALAERHRVYRPDVRGFGRSDAPGEDYRYSTDDLMGDILKIVDGLGIRRAHFVGESGGGIFSVLFALRHPNRVCSLVLCDTPMGGSDAVRSAYALGESRPGAAMLKLGVGEWCRQTLPYRLDVTKAPPEMQEWYPAEMGKTLPRIAATWNDYINSSGPLGPEGIAPLLQSLRTPVLLLGGERSKLAGEGLAAFARSVPNARLHVFPGYGHAINVLAPEACAAEALRFWSELEAST